MQTICYIGGTRLCPVDGAFCERFFAMQILAYAYKYLHMERYLLECVNKYTSLSVGCGGT